MPELLQIGTQHNMSQEQKQLLENVPQASQFIVKVTTVCSLGCPECYVFYKEDDSWREQPDYMSKDTINLVADRMAEELNDDPPPTVSVVFHGGDPPLVGADFLVYAANTIRRRVSDETVVRFTMQTAGSKRQITTDFLDKMLKARIGVAVSLNSGDPEGNKSRVYRSGQQSYPDVIETIRLLRTPKYRRLYNGLLAVVDLENDPAYTLNSLFALDPPRMDLLLPLGNWQIPPPGLETPEARARAPYGHWMAEAFDAWYLHDMHRMGMPRFSSIMGSLEGKASRVESFGGYDPDDPQVVVIATDGSLELVDTLSSVPGQFQKTGLDVRRHSIRQASAYMIRKAERIGAFVLPDLCADCPIEPVCGSGYLPHRYSKELLFANPAVYCEDHKYFITHVSKRMAERRRSDEASTQQVRTGQLPLHEHPQLLRDGMAIIGSDAAHDYYATQRYVQL